MESPKELRNGPERLHCITLKSQWHSVTLINGMWREGAFVWREIHTEQSIAKINTSLWQSNRKVQITMQGWKVSGSYFQLVLSAVAKMKALYGNVN